MDSKQIDLAMKHRVPVMYEGKRYAHIIEFVSWYDHSGKKSVRKLSVVLQDSNARATIRVPANKVSSVREV